MLIPTSIHRQTPIHLNTQTRKVYSWHVVSVSVIEIAWDKVSNIFILVVRIQNIFLTLADGVVIHFDLSSIAETIIIGDT